MAWLEDFTWVNKVTTLGPTNLNKLNRAIRNLLNAFPAGGITGQALIKNSNTDYDTAWATVSGAGGGGGGIGFGSNTGSNLTVETTSAGGISLIADTSDISMFAQTNSVDVTGQDGVNIQGRGNTGVQITTTGAGDILLDPGAGSNLDLVVTGSRLNITGLATTDPGGGVWSDKGTLRMSGSSGSRAAVATTVANLNTAYGGTPADGVQGMLRCGSSPYDYVSLIYDATLGKWVSEEFVVVGAMYNRSGIPIGTGLANFALSWPDFTNNANFANAFAPIRDYSGKATAGLTLQITGVYSCSAVDSGATGSARLGISFTTNTGWPTGAGTSNVWGKTWTSAIGPSSPAPVQNNYQWFDWLDVSTANFPTMSVDYWGTVSLYAAGADGTHRCRAADPYIRGRWTG